MAMLYLKYDEKHIMPVPELLYHTIHMDIRLKTMVLCRLFILDIYAISFFSRLEQKIIPGNKNSTDEH